MLLSDDFAPLHRFLHTMKGGRRGSKFGKISNGRGYTGIYLLFY